ncbi:hypothetical protein RI129_012525 [Pyrocoelia pectoralis]|uniref:Uncharacterized protein n=1 Tax=Pyrocoelia pectoralis TaxID=417401 RepID=A0AAN7UTI4_9COLE
MKACRTCLKVLYNDNDFLAVDTDDCNTNLPSVRSKLLTCVPELALDVIESAVICCTCFHALNAAYNFKNTCLQTEQKIISYTQCNGTNSVNIIDIVQGEDNFANEDVKPILNGDSALLQPQITLKEGAGYLQKYANLPYSPEFDVEVVESKRCNSSMLNNPYYDLTDINSHMLMYNEFKPFHCTECNKCFVRKDKLMLHMRIHTGEKPFKCTHCGRSFSRKDKMNNHERTHTGEKPFQCIFCQKSFSRKDRMNAHMRLHHAQAMANLEITVVNRMADNDKGTVHESTLQTS